MKKLVALLVASVMLLGITTAFAEPAVGGELIYGSGTEISGDWAHGAIWTNNATDNMIREMINDYSTVSFNQGGAMVPNASVTESMEGVVNEDGSKTYTIKIFEDLVFNDGSPITAKHFLASPLLFSHPTLLAMGSKNQAYEYYAGGQLYRTTRLTLELPKSPRRDGEAKQPVKKREDLRKSSPPSH